MGLENSEKHKNTSSHLQHPPPACRVQPLYAFGFQICDSHPPFYKLWIFSLSKHRFYLPPSTPPGKLLSCECPRFLKNVETPWFILFLYCYLQFLIPVPLRPLLMQSVPNGGFLCSSSEMWLCAQGLQPSSQHSFLLFSRGEVSLFPPLHHQPDFIIIT